MNIIILIIAGAGFGWWWSSNTVLQYLRKMFRIEWMGCEYCSAFLFTFIFSLINNINWLSIGIAGMAAFLAYIMKRESDKM